MGLGTRDARRLYERLGYADRGQTTHRLTVLTVMPAAARVEVRLEPGPDRRLPVVAGTGDASACRPAGGGQVRCRVELGALDGEEPGPWVVRSARGDGRGA